MLGDGWGLYAEGQKLQEESDSFRRKLETKSIFDSWLSDISRRHLSTLISGRIFDLKNRSQGGTFQLTVNFDQQIITLFKEVRNLHWLGFSIPHNVGNLAKDAKRVYPHAVSLLETVRTYTQTVALVNANPGIAALVSEMSNAARAQIAKGAIRTFARSSMY